LCDVTPERDDFVAQEWEVFRERTANGRSMEVIELADSIIASTDDPRRIVQALIEKLAARLNMGEARSLGPLIGEINARLHGISDSRLVGEFHSIAGIVSFESGSLSTAMMNLVRAEQALRRMTEVNIAAVDSWHDLSVAYSMCGFHAKAMEAQREAADLCKVGDLPPAAAVLIEARVRAAVGFDQRGDTTGCVRDLRLIVAAGGPLADRLEIAERVFLRYAVHRLGSLGVTVPLAVEPDESSDLFLDDVNRLTDVCIALERNEAKRAITLLDDAPNPLDVIGAAEPLRLRALALSQLGDIPAALTVEREALHVVMAEDHQLRELLTDSISARLDQVRLRRVAAEYAGKAYTDPLTGLPNRRRTAEVAASLAQQGKVASLGILDLDGFKAVNDTHGHPSGDLVLQRVAGIFARAARKGDLLARHGGDEFILILPETAPADAEDIGAQICAAVSGEDWSALVPGTPVSVSIGWALLDGDLQSAVKAADDALYRCKRSRR
jgi:diguanylate cyclase (GGDEF)-like protein